MRKSWWALAASVLLLACGEARPTASPIEQGAPEERSAPKRIVAGVRTNPAGLYARLTTGRYTAAPIEGLVHVGLSTLNDQADLVPRLAEEIPTVENGRWKVAADGRMELTWSIRPGVLWHDGSPFTAADLAFTASVVRDEALPDLGDAKYRFLDRVEAVDARTVRATWNQPFIEADRLFTTELAMPLPRHILESAYAEAKDRLLDLPYWSQEFVGTGPFRLQEWVLGSHLVVEANDRYVLGRPKIDFVEVRFITDGTTLIANILAGAVEVTLGTTGLSLEQVVELRERWRTGRVETAPANLRRLSPQFVSPTPAVIADVQFRRALLHAIDRQEIIDTLEGGLTAVPVSFLPPNRPEFREVEVGLPRYDYDVRRAMQLIEALGYSRGPDGLFREGTGASAAPLRVEIRTAAGDDNQNKIMFAVADYWQRAGVGVDPFVIPVQQSGDRQAHATRPGFYLSGGTSGLVGLQNLHSSQVPTPENSWVGSNTARYSSGEFDALYERYLVTIPPRERMQILAQILRHIAEQLPVLGVYYRVAPSLIADRIKQVGPIQTFVPQSWNAHEWRVE